MGEQPPQNQVDQQHAEAQRNSKACDRPGVGIGRFVRDDRIALGLSRMIHWRLHARWHALTADHPAGAASASSTGPGNQPATALQFRWARECPSNPAKTLFDGTPAPPART